MHHAQIKIRLYPSDLVLALTVIDISAMPEFRVYGDDDDTRYALAPRSEVDKLVNIFKAFGARIAVGVAEPINYR